MFIDGGNQSVGNVNVPQTLGTYTAFVDRSGANNNIILGSRGNFSRLNRQRISSRRFKW